MVETLRKITMAYGLPETILTSGEQAVENLFIEGRNDPAKAVRMLIGAREMKRAEAVMKQPENDRIRLLAGRLDDEAGGDVEMVEMAVGVAISALKAFKAQRSNPSDDGA
ncbi:hypothetical protein ACIBHX_46710 [Nonomuraea sp. NPDC050536]|uniref:hypothetical protein n=1 Tax=Nonomuraea sp. NPDC050536 TaxID=3364366 RepID=UPI0037C7A400